jgi:hypothetical protein
VTPKAQSSRTQTEATGQTAPMTVPWSSVTASAEQQLIRVIPAASFQTAPLAASNFPSVRSLNGVARQPLRMMQLPTPASSTPGSFLPGQRLV